MTCNLTGVSEVYIDQASHKITVVGMADPERMVKAIRKTKRIPTIFSHTDPAAAAAAEAQPPPPTAEAEGEAQAAPPPPADPPAADAAPPAAAEEAAPAPAEAPAPENKEATKPAETPAAMDATVVRTVHDDYPYGYGHGHRMYSEHWATANHPMDMHGVRYEASPYHRPTSPYVAEYGGGYGGFPVQEGSRYYSPAPAEYYPVRAKGDDRNITSIFSDENPNACSIA